MGNTRVYNMDIMEGDIVKIVSSPYDKLKKGDTGKITRIRLNHFKAGEHAYYINFFIFYREEIERVTQ